MTSFEIDAENLVASWEVRDGQRVIVLAHAIHTDPDEPDEVVLRLPVGGEWQPAYRLSLMLGTITDELRADGRHDAHRGGKVIASRLSVESTG